MNIRRYLIVAVAAIVGLACSPDSVDNNFIEELCFSNGSSHNIVLTIDKPKGSNNTPLVITLKPSEVYKSAEITLSILNRGCSVKFGNSALIDYKKISATSEYNILYQLNYTTTYPDDWHIVNTYTFTDADYQFALEHGTPVE